MLNILQTPRGPPATQNNALAYGDVGFGYNITSCQHAIKCAAKITAPLQY